jgi:hypothetical protein
MVKTSNTLTSSDNNVPRHPCQQPHRIQHLADLPLLADNRSCWWCDGEGCEWCVEEHNACEKCGSPERVEYHHWAPYHLFPDANDWPGSLLCWKCHRLWHSIVTPNMAKGKGAA